VKKLPKTFRGAEVVRGLGNARAMANGNVDPRVLRVSGQTLVVATRNEL
jgi:hypothetical protein